MEKRRTSYHTLVGIFSGLVCGGVFTFVACLLPLFQDPAPGSGAVLIIVVPIALFLAIPGSIIGSILGYISAICFKKVKAYIDVRNAKYKEQQPKFVHSQDKSK